MEKKGHIANPPVLFEVCHPGHIGPQDLSHFLIGLARELQAVVRVLDDDFMRAEIAHLVVNTLGPPLRLTFNAVDGPGMRSYSDLPITFSPGVLVIHLRTVRFLSGVEWTFSPVRLLGLSSLLSFPALGNRVFPKFRGSEPPESPDYPKLGNSR